MSGLTKRQLRERWSKPMANATRMREAMETERSGALSRVFFEPENATAEDYDLLRKHFGDAYVDILTNPRPSAEWGRIKP